MCKRLSFKIFRVEDVTRYFVASSHRIKQSHYNGNIIIIDGDTFRLQHPKFIDIQKEYGKKVLNIQMNLQDEWLNHSLSY